MPLAKGCFLKDPVKQQKPDKNEIATQLHKTLNINLTCVHERWESQITRILFFIYDGCYCMNPAFKILFPVHISVYCFKQLPPAEKPGILSGTGIAQQSFIK
jgi:hypothetical protein